MAWLPWGWYWPITWPVMRAHFTMVGAEALVEHVPEDAPVHRLEPVPHVGQGPGGDGGEGVDEVRLLHLRLQLDGLYVPELQRRLLLAHSRPPCSPTGVGNCDM